MPTDEFRSFADFWPYYLHEHSRPATRALHAAGTVASTVLIVALIVARKWAWLPLPFLVGYGAAWVGHFFVEHNRPATFQHPLWSFMGDYKMLALMLTGRMAREVVRCAGSTMRECDGRPKVESS